MTRAQFNKTFTSVAIVLESAKTIAALVNYTYKSFIKLTPESLGVMWAIRDAYFVLFHPLSPC